MPSARSRIVGMMLLLVATTLAVPAFGITLIWQVRLDAEMDDQLRSEADKLRRFAHTAREPATGEPFVDGASLLTEFMTVNLPRREEAFFSLVDGRADRRSPNAVPTRLDQDAAVVARLSKGSGTRIGWLDSPAGRVRYGVVPVRVAGTGTTRVW